MHTVEILDQAISAARHMGFDVRIEWLGGNGGGDCEVGGRKCVFLDLADGPAEQLDVILGALDREASATVLPIPPQVNALLRLRKIA